MFYPYLFTSEENISLQENLPYVVGFIEILIGQNVI